MRRFVSLAEGWGPLLVSLLVTAVYVFTLIATISVEPDGAAAAAYALITATAVFARILEGGSRTRLKALVTRMNGIVVTWAGYSAAFVWLLSETGPAIALEYRLVWIVATGVGWLASCVLVVRGSRES